VKTKGGLSHNGVSVNLSGRVTFIMSSKSVGMMESIYNSLKPITLADLTTQVSKSGKLYPSMHRFLAHLPLYSVFEASREMKVKSWLGESFVSGLARIPSSDCHFPFVF